MKDKSKQDLITIYNPNNFLACETVESETKPFKTKQQHSFEHPPPKITSSTLLSIPPKKRGRFNLIAKSSSSILNLDAKDKASKNGSIYDNLSTFKTAFSNMDAPAAFSASGTQRLQSNDELEHLSSCRFHPAEFPLPKYFDAYMSGKWQSKETSWKFPVPHKLKKFSSTPEKHKDGSSKGDKTENKMNRKIKRPVYKLGNIPLAFESNRRILIGPAHLIETAYDSILEIKLNELDEILRNHPPTKRAKLETVRESGEESEQQLCSGEGFSMKRVDSLDFIFHESYKTKRQRNVSSSETDDDMKYIPDDGEDNIFDQINTENKPKLAESTTLEPIHMPKKIQGKTNSMFFGLKKTKITPETHKSKTVSFRNFLSEKLSFNFSFLSFFNRKNKDVDTEEILPKDNSTTDHQEDELVSAGQNHVVWTMEEINNNEERLLEEYFMNNTDQNIQDYIDIIDEELKKNQLYINNKTTTEQYAYPIEEPVRSLKLDDTIISHVRVSAEKKIIESKSLDNTRQPQIEIIPEEEAEMDESVSEFSNDDEVQEDEVIEEHQVIVDTGSDSEEPSSAIAPIKTVAQKLPTEIHSSKKASFYKTILSLFQRKQTADCSIKKQEIKKQGVEKKGFFERLSLIFRKSDTPARTEEQSMPINEPSVSSSVVIMDPKHVDSLSLIRRRRWKLFEEAREFQTDSVMAYRNALARASMNLRTEISPPSSFIPSSAIPNELTSAKFVDVIHHIPAGSPLTSEPITALLGMGLWYKSTMSESVILPGISNRKRRFNERLFTDLDSSNTNSNSIVEENNIPSNVNDKPKLKGILKNVQ